jgi:hypothetical protein
MDAIDWLLSPVYLFFIYFLASSVVKRKGNNPLYKTYFLRGLRYKFIGVIFFDIIYLYYYGGGDSINFYYGMNALYKLFISDPTQFFSFVFSNTPYFPRDCFYEAKQHGIVFLLRGSASLTTIRIGALLNLLAFNNFIPLSLIFAYLSYRFQWKVFELICSIYPTLHKQFAYAFLMLPSVIFWGSGVGKDAVMLSCILQGFYSFYHIAILKKDIWRNVLWLLIVGYLMSLIRGFILFTLLPCLVLMTVTYYRTSIKNSALRLLVGPVFILVGVAASAFFVRSLGQNVESYNVESLEQKAEGFRSWHTTQGGSTYSLGENMEFTPLGILRQAPMAVLITLFGPFVWQIRNPVMLLSGIESLLFLYLFATRVFFNRRLYSIFSVLVSDHIVVFAVPFILILAVAIGLTSFNFGALVRYRIPILPFFAITFIIINYHLTRTSMRTIK